MHITNNYMTIVNFDILPDNNLYILQGKSTRLTKKQLY